MNLKHLLVFAALVSSVALSCKKDEETETKPSLPTRPTYSIPEFLDYESHPAENAPEDIAEWEKTVGPSMAMTPKKVTVSSGSQVGYYWKLTPATFKNHTQNDTIYSSSGVLSETGETVLVFNDSLYTCSVTCGAFADEYYSTTATTSVTFVKGGIEGNGEVVSITNAGFGKAYTQELFPDAAEVTDEYTVIGDYRWSRRNASETDKGLAYKGCEPMSDVYGKYYTYEETSAADAGICPDGWEIPSSQAWDNLEETLKASLKEGDKGIAASLMADALFNAPAAAEDTDEYKMWEYSPKVGDPTNSSAFSAIPAGFVNAPSMSFYGSYHPSGSSEKLYAAFLTSDLTEDGKVLYKFIVEGDPDLHTGEGDTASFAASVRCVKKL